MSSEKESNLKSVEMLKVHASVELRGADEMEERLDVLIEKAEKLSALLGSLDGKTAIL